MNADQYYTEQDVEVLARMHVTLPPSPSCCGAYMVRLRGSATYVCDRCHVETEAV